MFKRFALIALLLLFGAWAPFMACNPCSGGGGGSFTPAWQTLRTSGGGALALIHTYSDGTVVTTGDTFGPWILQANGTCTRDGTIYTAPCWTALATSDSLPAGVVSWATASSQNTTAVEIVAAPSNTNVLYMWYDNIVYVSTNRGASWTSTGLQVNYNPNGANKQTDWMAVDPANPDIVYLITPAGTYGPSGGSTGQLLVNTNGRSCVSSCWTPVAGIPTTTGYVSGDIVFDPTSSVVGGVTQGIYVSIAGSTGVWHSTNGGTGFTHQNTGSPPTTIYSMTVDKFGQLWAVTGFQGTSGSIYKFSSSTWTEITVATSTALISIFEDPNTGASVANNQMIAVDNNGQITATLNNGTDSWAHTIGVASLSLQSVSPQAGWLNVVNQYSFGSVAINTGAVRIDSTGKMWVATGIDMFSSPDPIVSGVLSTTATYSAATIGIDQLVNNMIVSPPGLGVLHVDWDRGVFGQQNPESFASAQYPNNSNNCSGCQIIAGGWGISYAPGTPSTLIAIVAGQGGGQAFGVTTTGGKSWNWLSTPPTGVGLSGVVAASTASHWTSVSSDNSGSSTVLQYTTSSGSSWANATFTGSPSPGQFISTGSCNLACANRQPLTADQVTADKYYIVDINQNFFSCTGTTLACSPTGATSASVDGITGSDRLFAEPGQASHVWYLGESGHLWKSTDGAATFTKLGTALSLDNLHLFGFGAAKPGGSGCSAVYAFQVGGGTAAVGFYQSTDCGTTWAALNVPLSEQVWASHLLDFCDSLSGDGDVYGRVYVGCRGGGPGYYIDTSDACPWVKYAGFISPGDTLAASGTLTAASSGKVPITSVNFMIDGVSVGTQTSGTPISGSSSISYSQPYSGLTTGSHTLSLQVIGNGCTVNVASITVTH